MAEAVKTLEGNKAPKKQVLNSNGAPNSNGEPKVLPLEKEVTKGEFPYDSLPPGFAELLEKVNKVHKGQRNFLASTSLLSMAAGLGNAVCLNFNGCLIPPVIHLCGVTNPGSSQAAAIGFGLQPSHTLEDQSFRDMDKDNALVRYVTDETSLKGIAKVRDTNATSLLLEILSITDVIESFGKYTKSTSADFFHKIWDDKTLITERKADEIIRIIHPNIIVFGATTRASILSVGRSTKGLIQSLGSLIYVLPESTEMPLWSTEELHESVAEDYLKIFERLNELSGGDNGPKKISFTAEAKIEVNKYLDHLVNLINGTTNDGLKNIYEGFQDKFLRLSLVLEGIHYAFDGITLESVDIKAVKGAIQLTEYFINNAIGLYKEMSSQSPLELLSADKRALYDALPVDEFTTSHIIAKCSEMTRDGVIKMSERTAHGFLNDLMLFEKVSHGVYRKSH
jgi:hypothetical protein